MKKGGVVKKMKKGGIVSSASKRADGIAIEGKPWKNGVITVKGKE
jgi:hypothetical protein